MPDYITDVAISELSLVFAQKDGKAYRPVNPDAVVLSTKAQEAPRPTLLGKYAEQLTNKASSEVQAEAELKVAYSTITSVLYAAIDDLYSISYAPETFTVEARKDAVRTVVDNLVTSIKDASTVVLKSQVVDPTPSIAQPPFQAPPGDHPLRPAPTLPNPAAPDEQPQQPVSEPTIAEPEKPVEGDPKQEADKNKTTEPNPDDKPADPPAETDKAQTLTEVQALIATFKAESEKKDAALKAATDAAKSANDAAAAAKAQLEALVGDARKPTDGASAPREIQADTTVLNGAAPNFKAMAAPGSSGVLESAIMAQLVAAQSTVKL